VVGRTLGIFPERVLSTVASTRGLIGKSGPSRQRRHRVRPFHPRPHVGTEGVEKVREAPVTQNKASEAKVF
jgi:hypothetical protein